VKGDAVEALVLETLQKVNKYATTNEAEFTRQINELYSTQQAGTVKAQHKKLKTSQARHAEFDKLIQRLYEDNVAGKINDRRFEVLSNQYEQEQLELEQTIAQIQADLNSFDDSTDRAAKFLELTKRYKKFTELTPSMLHTVLASLAGVVILLPRNNLACCFVFAPNRATVVVHFGFARCTVEQAR